ncbi:eukaryotic translation initiation factor eIF1-like [Procambarus clarkii]|uniref:eukaryotic translation initiation factor eIF1-like n=1 Tax=Procambarus clarkii TaxID=6728 RepID=UPI0037440952
MSIQNLNTFDPFADAARGTDEGVQDGLVHIRIQQRNGRKTLTTVQGLSSDYDLKKIVRACKKEFACNGTVVEHPEYGEVSFLNIIFFNEYENVRFSNLQAY